MRRLITAFAVVALPLTLAACGDDASTDSAGADTTAAATETTADGTETTEGTDTTAGSNGGTGDFTEYCGLIQQYMDERDSMSVIIDMSNPDPAAAEAALADMQSMLQNLADEAPDEIAADVELVNQATAAMAEVFAIVDYDVTKVQSNPEALAKIQELSTNTEYDDAASRLDAWGIEQCGFES